MKKFSAFGLLTLLPVSTLMLNKANNYHSENTNQRLTNWDAASTPEDDAYNAAPIQDRIVYKQNVFIVQRYNIDFMGGNVWYQDENGNWSSQIMLNTPDSESVNFSFCILNNDLYLIGETYAQVQNIFYIWKWNEKESNFDSFLTLKNLRTKDNKNPKHISTLFIRNSTTSEKLLCIATDVGIFSEISSGSLNFTYLDLFTVQNDDEIIYLRLTSINALLIVNNSLSHQHLSGMAIYDLEMSIYKPLSIEIADIYNVSDLDENYIDPITDDVVFAYTSVDKTIKVAYFTYYASIASYIPIIIGNWANLAIAEVVYDSVNKVDYLNTSEGIKAWKLATNANKVNIIDLEKNSSLSEKIYFEKNHLISSDTQGEKTFFYQLKDGMSLIADYQDNSWVSKNQSYLWTSFSIGFNFLNVSSVFNESIVIKIPAKKDVVIPVNNQTESYFVYSNNNISSLIDQTIEVDLLDAKGEILQTYKTKIIEDDKSLGFDFSSCDSRYEAKIEDETETEKVSVIFYKKDSVQFKISAADYFDLDNSYWTEVDAKGTPIGNKNKLTPIFYLNKNNNNAYCICLVRGSEENFYYIQISDNLDKKLINEWSPSPTPTPPDIKPDNSKTDRKILSIGLGVGLGVGLPVSAMVVYSIIKFRRSKSKFD